MKVINVTKLNSLVFLAFCFFTNTNSYAEQYWTDGISYYNSLSQLCNAKASASGGELCDVSPIISYLGTLQQGSCWIGGPDCSSARWYSYTTDERYTLASSLDNNQNTCPLVGNPVNPVTGNKFQRESIIQINALEPLNFDLIYNSERLEKWRHTFSRNLSFSSFPNGNRIDFNGSPLGPDPVADLESPSFIGGELSSFGRKNTVPDFSLQYDVFSTVEQACVTGWAQRRESYHYSWIDTSVAEYRLTPISSFGAVGQCYILDKPGAQGGQVKKIFDVFDVIGGNPPAYSSGPFDSFLRFTREDGRVIVFSNFEVIVNRSKTGETLERVDTNGVITYRLNTNSDEIEEYSSDGKLLSITSSNGYIKSLIYDSGTGLLQQVTNQTGESLTFNYETYGDTDQYSRLKTITDHTGRNWTLNYDSATFTLVSVNFPDGNNRQYHYDDLDDLQLLTGITDETGKRYATWAYDDESRATLSAHGIDQSKDKVELEYLTNGQRTVTKKRTSTLPGEPPLDIVSTYMTHTGGDSPIVAEITGNSPVKFEHDAETGYLEYSIEDPGATFQQRTEYSNYDSKGNPGAIKEAVNTTEQRETSYTYDSRYHSKVESVAEASVFPGNQKVSTNQYDDFGNNTAVTISGFRPDGTAVSRSTAFQYNGPYHQLTQIDGPRSDVSDIYTIDYYPDNATEGDNRARMKRVVAPLNITLYENITYTPTGKIKTYIDMNNVQTTMSYYFGNDRLQSLLQLDYLSMFHQ